MSYSEYLNMFLEVQKQKCLYRAFTFDVVGSKNQVEYQTTRQTKFFNLIDCVYNLLEQEEIKTNKQILLKDKHSYRL